MSRCMVMLQQAHEARAFSGASYALGTSAGVVERGVVGTLAWDGEAVGADSLWDLASVTKPIVALGAMVLLEQGALRLDDQVGHFLPAYRETDKAALTVRQLLTHSSGIPGQQPLYREATRRDELLDAIRRLPLRFAPGTDVEYTSQGFMVLGQIIEAAADDPLDRFLTAAVLDVVGMNETLFNPPADLRPRVAATEVCPWRGRLVRGEVHDENACVLGGVAAHAGLFSTVDDLALLCGVLLREGASGRGRPLLSAATVAVMTRNHTSHLRLARALGWQAKDVAGSPAGDLVSSGSYGHTGFTGTSVWIDPAADRFVVLLTNRVHPSRDNDALSRLRPLFHNAAYAMAPDHDARRP